MEWAECGRRVCGAKAHAPDGLASVGVPAALGECYRVGGRDSVYAEETAVNG